MKISLRNKKVKKIFIITTISITAILFIGAVGSYLLLHSYIRKINLINNVGKDASAIALESLEDEVDMALDEDSDGSGDDLLDGGALTEDTTTDEISSVSSGEYNSVRSRALMKEESYDKNIQNNLDITNLMDDKNVTNILLIGSDTREENDRGRSDSMIVITINNNTKQIIATSFLRDIYLNIPGKENNRLNVAYASGGAERLMETLQQNFKFQINKYIMVDFVAFVDIVDAIGGINIEVKSGDLDTINSLIRGTNHLLGENPESGALTKSGLQLLNGKQALSYSRNRSTKNGDFDRTEKQREVLMAIYEKVKKLNILQMNDLLNAILPQITTNFSEKEILSLILKMPAYLDYSSTEWSVPVAGSYENVYIRGMAVLSIDFDQNIREIQQRLYQIE